MEFRDANDKSGLEEPQLPTRILRRGKEGGLSEAVPADEKKGMR